MKEKLRLLRPLCNLHLLLCLGIGWMITNGWSYILLGLGTLLHSPVLIAVASGYLALLWLPFTPEKLITVLIAAFLMKKLFPRDIENLKTLIGLIRSKKKPRSGACRQELPPPAAKEEERKNAA